MQNNNFYKMLNYVLQATQSYSQVDMSFTLGQE